MGNSGLYKSAACNLLFSRNKEATDEVERNTTIMKATKIRWTGKTGIAGKYYYDNQKHTLYDLDDWMEENGVTEF
jgi:predicted nucleotide-binding protein (sugar kinase/HSP70/actin superfamily)